VVLRLLTTAARICLRQRECGIRAAMATTPSSARGVPQAGQHDLGLRCTRHVLTPATATASRPASHDADQTPLARDGMKEIIFLLVWKVKWLIVANPIHPLVPAEAGTQHSHFSARLRN
jgi:hypothetical protein